MTIDIVEKDTNFGRTYGVTGVTYTNIQSIPAKVKSHVAEQNDVEYADLYAKVVKKNHRGGTALVIVSEVPN